MGINARDIAPGLLTGEFCGASSDHYPGKTPISTDFGIRARNVERTAEPAAQLYNDFIPQ